MTWTCPTCGTDKRKKSGKKYCSRHCSNLGRRLIHIDVVRCLRLQGLTYAQMENYIPATGPGISNAMAKRGHA